MQPPMELTCSVPSASSHKQAGCCLPGTPSFALVVPSPLPALQAADSQPPVGARPCLDRAPLAQQLPGSGNAAVASTCMSYDGSLEVGPCMMLCACSTHALLAPGLGDGLFRSR